MTVLTLGLHDKPTHPLDCALNVAPSRAEVHRFGSFELHTSSGILLRDGLRIRIEDLPLRMLEGLLKRPGQILTRDELRNALWGEDVFDDFDNRLNVAAKKVREALTDPRDDSQFVETVRGRGYRFSGLVTSEVVGEALPESFTGGSEASLLVTADTQNTLCRWLKYARNSIHPALGVAAVMLLGGTAATLAYRYLHRPLLAEHNKVALGSFVNFTRDAGFDGVLFSALQTKLQESPYLTLISTRDFRSALKLAGAPTQADETQACSSLDGQILLRGEISSRSVGYEVKLTAWDCGGSGFRAVVKSVANSQRQVLSTLDYTSEQMRRRLGESDASIRRFNVPIGQATTSSLAAMKAFTVGEQKRLAGQEAESIPDYALAVDLDPQFAIAFARLGTVYMNLGEDVQSRRYYQKAFDLRERTDDWERLYITSHYYGESTGQIRNAIEADQVWHSVYPRDVSPIYNLAVNYIALGEAALALESAHLAVGLEPSLDMSQAILAEAYLRSGDYGRLAVMCSDLVLARNGLLPFHNACYILAFTRGDSAQMQLQLQWAHGSPEENQMIEESAWMAVYQGEIHRARALFAEAGASALKNHLNEATAKIATDEADLLADVGLSAEARVQALHGLRLAPDTMDVEIFAALALARAGETDQANSKAAEAVRQAPLDTLLVGAKLPAVRAAIQLANHDPQGALRTLDPARTFDLCTAMALASPYYRGLAYVQTSQLQKAAAEFQLVVDHRTLVPDSPYVALAQLELGHALQLDGKPKRATAAFAATENIWKQADSDFPPLVRLHDYQRQLAAARRF